MIVGGVRVVSNKIWKCLFQQPALHYSGKQPERRNDKAVLCSRFNQSTWKVTEKEKYLSVAQHFSELFLLWNQLHYFWIYSCYDIQLAIFITATASTRCCTWKKRTVNDKTNTQNYTGNSFEISFQTDYHTLCCSYISLKLGPLNF